MSCSLTEGAAPVGRTCVCGVVEVHSPVLCVPLYYTLLENIHTHFMREGVVHLIILRETALCSEYVFVPLVVYIFS